MKSALRQSRYFHRTNLWPAIRFWLRLLFESSGPRRPDKILRARLYQSVTAEGLENVPRAGTFLLAVNHYHGSATLDMAALAIMVCNRVRPELANDYLLVIGKKARDPANPPPLLVRLVVAVMDKFFRRWSANIVRIPWRNPAASPAALREWRRRLKIQPGLVFPEGQTSLEFDEVRPGAGRWLASLDCPVLPVAGWWDGEGWQVRVGQPLKWTTDPELRDLQLGLNIARLLPQELAPDWQEALAQWQQTHKNEASLAI